MNIEQQDYPGHTGLSTAALAHVEENDNQHLEDELDETGRSAARADLRAGYPGESNGNPRLVAGDPAEIQSAQDSPRANSPSSTDHLTARTDGDRAEPLFAAGESKDFNSRWDSVQVTFVDEPRQAVQKADELVASAIHRLAEVFAKERARLEEQWDRGDSVSTEDLRVALQRYRSFFRRLLAV